MQIDVTTSIPYILAIVVLIVGYFINQKKSGKQNNYQKELNELRANNVSKNFKIPSESEDEQTSVASKTRSRRDSADSTGIGMGVIANKIKKNKMMSKSLNHLQLLHLSHQKDEIASPALKSTITKEEQVQFEDLFKKTNSLRQIGFDKKKISKGLYNDIQTLDKAIQQIVDTDSLISALELLYQSQKKFYAISVLDPIQLLQLTKKCIKMGLYEWANYFVQKLYKREIIIPHDVLDLYLKLRLQKKQEKLSKQDWIKNRRDSDAGSEHSIDFGDGQKAMDIEDLLQNPGLNPQMSKSNNF